MESLCSYWYAGRDSHSVPVKNLSVPVKMVPKVTPVHKTGREPPANRGNVKVSEGIPRRAPNFQCSFSHTKGSMCTIVFEAQNITTSANNRKVTSAQLRDNT